MHTSIYWQINFSTMYVEENWKRNVNVYMSAEVSLHTYYYHRVFLQANPALPWAQGELSMKKPTGLQNAYIETKILLMKFAKHCV